MRERHASRISSHSANSDRNEVDINRKAPHTREPLKTSLVVAENRENNKKKEMGKLWHGSVLEYYALMI
jgi:hypothetical protein